MRLILLLAILVVIAAVVGACLNLYDQTTVYYDDQSTPELLVMSVQSAARDGDDDRYCKYFAGRYRGPLTSLLQSLDQACEHQRAAADVVEEVIGGKQASWIREEFPSNARPDLLAGLWTMDTGKPVAIEQLRVQRRQDGDVEISLPGVGVPILARLEQGAWCVVPTDNGQAVDSEEWRETINTLKSILDAVGNGYQTLAALARSKKVNAESLKDHYERVMSAATVEKLRDREGSLPQPSP